jgi:hypothetical protein
MKKLLIAAVTFSAITAGSIRAEVGVVEATGAFSINGGSTIYISSVGGGGNPRWSGYSFGDFDLTVPNTLTLQNFYFENYAYNGGSIPPGGSFNNNWLDNTSTATLTIYRNAVAIYSTLLRQSNVNGSNRNWDITATGVLFELLDGVTGTGPQDFGFVVDWTYNQWTGSEVLVGGTATSPGGNAIANVTAVPEPSTVALLTLSALGVAGYAARRRARK